MTATSPVTATDPQAVVRTFLEALQSGDFEHAFSLLAEDAQWINVSLPAIKGRTRIEGAARFMFERLGMYFRVHFHNVAEDGGVVLTERSDAIGLGRFEQRFWVHGRFEVHDGKIAIWRDSFDWGDLTVSLVRGAIGIVAPQRNRPWPPQH